MIRIEIDEPTLARTRIATSPLLETICGLWLLGKDPSTVPWPYTDWVRRARQAPMPEPVRLYHRLGRMMPDFLVPMPVVAAPSFEEQIDLFRRTPAEVVATQIAIHHPHGAPPPLRPFLDDRVAALNGLADGLSAWWEAVMAPSWPAMRAALDEEVLLRARALAADGPAALLSRLHERIRWEPPVLTVVKQLEHSFSVTDQRLLLVPLIFSRGGLPCSTDDPDVVMVTYQARGAAVLADGHSPVTDRPGDRLSLLIGRGRATVLRALTDPATTTGLATALGLAPSTVSEHLAALQAAGVVHRRRTGRRVLYGLEPAGLALVKLLGEDSAATEFVS